MREGASGRRGAALPLRGRCVRPCCAACGGVVLAELAVEYDAPHVGVALELQPEGVRPTETAELQRTQLAGSLQMARGCGLTAGARRVHGGMGNMDAQPCTPRASSVP